MLAPANGSIIDSSPGVCVYTAPVSPCSDVIRVTDALSITVDAAVTVTPAPIDYPHFHYPKHQSNLYFSSIGRTRTLHLFNNVRDRIDRSGYRSLYCTTQSRKEKKSPSHRCLKHDSSGDRHSQEIDKPNLAVMLSKIIKKNLCFNPLSRANVKARDLALMIDNLKYIWFSAISDRSAISSP